MPDRPDGRPEGAGRPARAADEVRRPRGGRPPTDAGEILNALFHPPRSGEARRVPPHDFPPRRIVYAHFRRWRIDGTWEHLHDRRREEVRGV